MARPRKEIDEAQLKALMRLKPTLKDTAAFFEVSEDTIERTIKKLSDIGFAEFRDQNMVHTRFSLIRKAISKAESGDNIMLIFCLKNLCEWKDKPEGQADVNIMFGSATDEASLDKRIKELEAKRIAKSE